MKLKEIIKKHSIYMWLLTICESLLSIICTLSFVYSDSLNYSDSLIFNELGIEKVLETMYSSTWWALILFLLSGIAITSITTMVYKKMEYMFIGIMMWVQMLILSINFQRSFTDNLMSLLLFVPIIILNVIAYKSEKNKIETKSKNKK